MRKLAIQAIKTMETVYVFLKTNLALKVSRTMVVAIFVFKNLILVTKVSRTMELV